jgi:hypothetical protein
MYILLMKTDDVILKIHFKADTDTVEVYTRMMQIWNDSCFHRNDVTENRTHQTPQATMTTTTTGHNLSGACNIYHIQNYTEYPF